MLFLRKELRELRNNKFVLPVYLLLPPMRLSAKMTDPQSANQFTGLVIVPTFMLGIGIFGKVLTMSMAAVAIACVVVVLLTLFLLRLNLKNFQREEIHTKWK